MAATSTAQSPPSFPAPGGVQTYRAFFVARNGRVTGMVPLRAASEDEARVLARALVEGEDVVELWSGLHAVARFERPERGVPRP